MPFTFSHIGYILPIQKKWKDKFSISGLVFGSLAPDYDILFRLTKIRFHIFQYDINTILFLIFPFALLSALVFHVFCRNIIIENLPLMYEKKYERYKSFNFVKFLKAHYLIVATSVIFAILLHLVLDFLCHCLNAYYVKMFVLKLTQNDIIVNGSYLFSIYGLPVLFSLLGFYLIYVYEYHKRISIRSLAVNKTKLRFWLTMLLFNILFLVIKFYITEVDNEFFIDYVIISITSSFLIALYATCIFYFFMQKLKFA